MVNTAIIGRSAGYIRSYLNMSQAQHRSGPPGLTKEAQLRSYQKRLKDDVKSMVDNFQEIMRIVKVDEETHITRPARAEQDQYEMEVRSANIVRAGESLMKLVSDVKQFLVLNDFRSVNESISHQISLFQRLQGECDSKLLAVRDDMAADLFELEEDYYSSVYK